MKKPKSNHQAKPRRVDFFQEAADFNTALLGSLGFSTRCIIEETQLTPCQITYRLHKAKVKRADYRNGNSRIAHNVMQKAKDWSSEELVKHLKEVL